MTERDRHVEHLDVAVIGAGVVGLAIARELSHRGREVVVFERNEFPGMETSSHNSGVIHSSIYYATGSSKAQLCVEGRHAMYEFCQNTGVDHRRLGKLIVATRDEEIPTLQKLQVQGAANGVNDLVWLNPNEIGELEPQVRCVAVLYSPSTGIIDRDGFMKALRHDAEARGGIVQINTSIERGEVRDDGVALQLKSSVPNTPERVLCRTVINSAGLYAQEVARVIAGFPQDTIPQAFYTKGHYFELAGSSPFSHLVYPVPVPGGLGIHVTLDLANRARFGPDVLTIDKIDYSFNELRAAQFYEAIRTYYPDLQDSDLRPGYTGIRPQLGPPGSGFHDFMIQGPGDHGVPGFINLFGIESPGFTAALAIARSVADLLEASK